MHFRIMLWKLKFIITKIRSYLLLICLVQKLSSSLYTLLKLSTSPNKLFDNDCAVTKKRRFPIVYIFLSLEEEDIFRIIKTNVFVRKVLTLMVDHNKKFFFFFSWKCMFIAKYKKIWSKTRNFRFFVCQFSGILE